MAILSGESLLNGIRGKVGNLVFRQFQGKTIVQLHQEHPTARRSESQRLSNQKMREAARQARAALRNPAVKAHYEKKKKRLNVTSAYTAACTDFLRKGRIDSIDTTKYDKGVITVKAVKPDLGFEELVLKVSPKNGAPVVTTRGVAKDKGHWLFKITTPLPCLSDVIISVEAKDKIGNITRAICDAGKPHRAYHDWKGAPHLTASRD